MRCYYLVLVALGISALTYTFLRNFKIPVVYNSDAPTESTYNNIDPQAGLIPFLDPKVNLYGYKSPAGEVVIPPQFDRALEFSIDGIADVYIKSSKAFFRINKVGQILVQAYFFDNGPDYFVQGLSRFVENGKIGFIDKKAHKVIPAQFDWASAFWYDPPIAVVGNGCQEVDDPAGHGLTVVKGGQWGAIDQKGKIIVPLVYDRFACSDEDGKRILTFYKGNQPYKLFYTIFHTYVLAK